MWLDLPNFDGELLDDNDGAADSVFGDFGEVDGDLGGADADCNAVEHAADDELRSAGRRDLQRGADEPEYTCCW